MPFDPLEVIAECLGEPADSMRNPANADYRCPWIDGRCRKVSHRDELPYPVCSIYRRGRPRPGHEKLPVCVCPVRFYEADIVQDVIAHCWTGSSPAEPRLAHEVQMAKFGKVDLVVAEVNPARSAVLKFLPIELQAVDITGTYGPAYEALTQNRFSDVRSSHGLNWANVRKRFMSQLVSKGYYCNGWGTRIVAVVQEDLFDHFDAHSHITEVQLRDSNIVFMLYQFERLHSSAQWSLKLKRVVPTTHQSVMTAILYETPPSRAAFERKILERLVG